MRSLLIEFHRFKALDTGVLRQGDEYLVAASSQPVRSIVCPLDHLPFLRLMLALRYQQGAASRAAALRELGTTTGAMLGIGKLRELDGDSSPLQLDLVVNAAELAALPFEAALDDAGRPLLAQPGRILELTRRVRHDFAGTSVRWPAQPRVLFAWACPPGVGLDVPHAAHFQALRAALSPWIPARGGEESVPDPAGVLTTLPEFSLAALHKICREAVDRGTPFTHVHLLAHGYPIGSGFEQRFGIALHTAAGGDLEAAAPEELCAALAPLAACPTVVTLAACDAANTTNSVAPERSIAHELHVAGFPVVIASQLPLTVPGSNLLVERFYNALLAGRDVRIALHETRCALYENRESAGHDWTSLVGYVRLPEGYADHLLEVRLEAAFAAIRTIQASADALVESGALDPALFDEVGARLRGRIASLEGYLEGTEMNGHERLLHENLGLLGSAEKRFAELCAARERFDDPDNCQRLAREALTRACGWYRFCFEGNLSHHWSGAQYLSLEAALSGRIADPRHWQAALAGAEIDRREPAEYWAQGSLAELYLLASTAGQPSGLEAAVDVLEEMKSRVLEFSPGDRFPLESTRRQLRRYTDWWTTANGYFPGRSDLAPEAGRLLETLGR